MLKDEIATHGRDRIDDILLATYIQSVPLVVKQPPFSFSF